MMKKYVQFGCGLSAPKEWLNFDVSPTLRIQKTPILGTLLKNQLNTRFPENVLYGDILKGLPLENESCDALYSSHTLEHLSLEDLRLALKNVYVLLKPDGIFRCVLPDLEWAAKTYIENLSANKQTASIDFLNETLLGERNRKRGLKAIASSILGNSKHLWMWDYLSLSNELEEAGFRNIRRCAFNDSKDPMFEHVESEGRFENALAIECQK